MVHGLPANITSKAMTGATDTCFHLVELELENKNAILQLFKGHNS